MLSIPSPEYMTICLSTDTYLGSFQDLEIMDKAAMRVLVQAFEFEYLFVALIDVLCYLEIVVISVSLIASNAVHFYPTMLIRIVTVILPECGLR